MLNYVVVCQPRPDELFCWAVVTHRSSHSSSPRPTSILQRGRRTRSLQPAACSGQRGSGGDSQGQKQVRCGGRRGQPLCASASSVTTPTLSPLLRPPRFPLPPCVSHSPPIVAALLALPRPLCRCTPPSTSPPPALRAALPHPLLPCTSSSSRRSPTLTTPLHRPPRPPFLEDDSCKG